MIKKNILFIYLFLVGLLNAAEWFDNNRNLKNIFPEKIWYYVERADYYDTRGNLSVADSYLRLAQRKTDEAKPFNSANWPKGWPQRRDALKILKYASPDAYLNKLIGDFALYHSRPKEALIYYSTYLELSIIPDTDIMMKMAEIYKKENRWRDAKVIYDKISKTIDANNFHGTKFSLTLLSKLSKDAELKLIKPSILTLDILFRNIPDFIKTDMQKLFSEEIDNMQGYVSVSKKVFNKAMSETNVTVEDFKHEDELSNFGKALNVNYILRPVLTRIDDYYIFQVDIFNVSKTIWFETYEYKTESYQYLQNFAKRFTYQFQNEDIPDTLFIPENNLLWNYEADSFITDFSFSKESKRTIIGTENGVINIFNSQGRLIKRFNVPQKIIKTAISPCGKYSAWVSLEGILYFAEINSGIKWKREVKNYARGLDIADDGRFLIVSINDGIIFKDKKGETFWDSKFPQWVSYVKISNNSSKVYVGMDNGQYWCISDEGNILWKKSLNNRVSNINVSKNNYNCVVTEKGKTFLFDDKGNELISFEDGQDVEYSVFDSEVLNLMAGKKGNYFYILSPDKKKLWRYNLSGKTSFISTVEDGTFLTTVEGRNIFSFKISWL